jgi:hypothetical protein
MHRETVPKCISTQDTNAFGFAVGDGRYLQISLAGVKDKSTFDALYAVFQTVAPGDAMVWLEENGAVLVTDGAITQTITVVGISERPAVESCC